jgi:DNA-binding NtrC family response regulator
MGRWNVLLVTDDSGTDLADSLLDWGIKVTCCRTITQALSILARQSVSQVFCSADLPDGSYRNLVKIAKLMQPETRVVVLVPEGSGERIFKEALEAGAFDTIPYPASRPEVQWEVVQAMRESSEPKAA